MTRIIPLGVALCLLLTAPLLANEAAEKLVKKGDKYYANRGKGSKWVEKAVECYEKALAVDTKSVPASWKLAMSCYWLGSRQGKAEEQLATFQKGIDAAKRAITIDDESVESHYWLGVCYGKYGEAKGVMNSLGLVEPIKAEMKRVIELDEKFGHGGAYVVLGRMYYKLPGIAGGSNEKSLEYFEKALKIDKGHLLTHLFLADTYLALDREKDAIRALKFVIDADYQEDRKPENEEEKEKAKKRLAELNKDEEEKKD